MLAVISTRLVNYLIVNQIELSSAQFKNLVSFLTMEVLPNDLRLSIVQEIVKSKNCVK